MPSVSVRRRLVRLRHDRFGLATSRTSRRHSPRCSVCSSPADACSCSNSRSRRRAGSERCTTCTRSACCRGWAAGWRVTSRQLRYPLNRSGAFPTRSVARHDDRRGLQDCRYHNLSGGVVALQQGLPVLGRAMLLEKTRAILNRNVTQSRRPCAGRAARGPFVVADSRRHAPRVALRVESGQIRLSDERLAADSELSARRSHCCRSLARGRRVAARRRGGITGDAEMPRRFAICCPGQPRRGGACAAGRRRDCTSDRPASRAVSTAGTQGRRPRSRPALRNTCRRRSATCRHRIESPSSCTVDTAAKTTSNVSRTAATARGTARSIVNPPLRLRSVGRLLQIRACSCVTGSTK